MSDFRVILSTCGSAEEAERIARALVQERVAACVNVVPGVRSFYRWKGALEEGQEWLLIVKSSAALFPALRARLAELHSYEVPEALALGVLDGAPSYLAWLESELKPN